TNATVNVETPFYADLSALCTSNSQILKLNVADTNSHDEVAERID
ncbi:284_t:CDS:1, partial [Funneliformis mosseae]